MTLPADILLAVAAEIAPVERWWSAAKMWTLMYRGGLLGGTSALVVFILWRIIAAKRERIRLETLVASRTRQFRQSEELFRSIFEHATEGIYQSSLDGRNLRANPAMARICGYATPDEMQRGLTDVAAQFYVLPGRRQEINAAVADAGSVVGWESEIRRRDGSTIWISESVRAVIDPASETTVYQGSIVDVTARREMQAAQERARLAAEAANAAKSAFLTHVTHELRTPLTGILSNARVALRDAALDPANRARYGLINSSGEHLLYLIDEVLDLSRIEAGRLELQPVPVQLGDLLWTVTDAFRSRAADKALDFQLHADPELPNWVRADPVRLRQILDNLLENAFKFTTTGKIELRVRRTGTDAVTRFEVADTGIGIPGDQLAVIFEPFRQTPHPSGPRRSGVGLGLHISTRLAEAMSGRLWVESTLGQGSRFFFELPLPEADSGETLPGDSMGQAAIESPPPRQKFAVPPPAELDRLLKFSLEGDIIRLRARLQELRTADHALTPFAQRVDGLAAQFHMDAISELLGWLKANEVPASEERP